MFLVGIISWWYGRGWKGQLGRVSDRFLGTIEFFSVGQLFLTLFAPFRQISAGRTDGPLGAVLRAFVDQLISRIIGAIVRWFTINVGIAALILQATFEGIVLVLWLLFPLLPVVGFLLLAIGWVPQWM